MPELPEVETVRRGLEAVLTGKRIAAVEVRRADLRWPLPAGFAGAIVGRRVARIGRRAKYLQLYLDDGMVVLAHLGMSGRMIIDRRGRNAPADNHAALADSGAHGRHEHVVFAAEDGTLVRYSDPRRFGAMDLCPGDRLETHKWLENLGPEPLGPAFDGAALAARLKGKGTSIKAALLDQRVVAGLGNIYVCEALFEAGLSPRRKAGSVAGARAARLAASIQSVLARAIAAGGSSLRDHMTPDGALGYFQHSFKVYDREGTPCPDCDCGGAVRRIVQGGRSSFYCATRQR